MMKAKSRSDSPLRHLDMARTTALRGELLAQVDVPCKQTLSPYTLQGVTLFA